jgi:hypothetical protein
MDSEECIGIYLDKAPELLEQRILCLIRERDAAIRRAEKAEEQRRILDRRLRAFERIADTFSKKIDELQIDLDGMTKPAVPSKPAA